MCHLINKHALKQTQSVTNDFGSLLQYISEVVPGCDFRLAPYFVHDF